MSSMLDEDRPCSVDELENILTAPSGGLAMLPSSAYDEVHDNIYIGEGDSAKSIGCMKRLGITHVLNASLGKTAYHVNTNHVMYKRSNIVFLGVEATDFMNQNMTQYFDKAADFIADAMLTKGKVFVHCVQGVSRSATLVLAYLMIKCYMTAQDAIRLVRSKREIFPNPGFLQQLCDLNETLKKKGHFKQICKSLNMIDATSCQQNEAVCTELNTASAFHLSKSDKKISDKKICTVEEVEKIIMEAMPEDYEYNEPYHQINECIFLGDGRLAQEVIKLKKLGITHILNAALHKGCDNDAQLYRSVNIGFLGFPAEDKTDYDISPFFTEAADFIESVVSVGGKVYVHCVVGMSRSATLLVAYFMIKQRKCIQDAVRIVKAKRDIDPNSAFMQQLCDLDLKLNNIR